MKRQIYLLTIFIFIICIGLTACSNHTEDKPHEGKILGDNSSTRQINSSVKDSLTSQKVELAKIYTQAIAEFIKVAYIKDKTTFDTLYFGKHIYGQSDDFPDIELPNTIEKTEIRLVSPEVGQKKQKERRSLFYVNLMGWVDKERAEFIFVVFTNGGAHQYDYFINFNYKNSLEKFELDKIEFQNNLYSSEQKPKRITIYKDSKYVEEN